MRQIKLLAILLAICSPVYAQDLEDYVSKYTSENGKGYMQPLADAFGANINSGLYHGARIPTLGFNIYIGVETMMALIADDQKVFTAKTEDPFSPPISAETSTIFGSTTGAAVTGTGGTVYNFPGGLDVSKVPLAVPQVTVGSILGTEATLRWIQVTLDDNYGKVKLFGFGARHSISQYLENFPVDLAAGFFIQKLEVGDIVEANAKYFGVQGSYSKSVLTFYGGLGFESANLDIAYEFESSDDSASTISFDLDSDNSVRFTAGVAINLILAKLHVDYNFGAQKVLAAGAGFGL
jgi:hypothetical protein